MADTRVVDTNVLIVASAAHQDSPFEAHATPLQEAEHLQTVLKWVEAFHKDVDRHMVLDVEGHISNEYRNKLSEQNYGLLMMQHKISRGQVAWVYFDVDQNGHAKLSDALTKAVTDREDRKMVAAVLEAKVDGHTSKLVNACDTDWLDCEKALKSAGVEAEHLLEEQWLRPRWRAKKQKKT
ncbi:MULTISPECIES: hypothetical protein [unclassified Pseudomonas]|uniref:hypothetical protein n=1 Tax=unclassified Pseudomonas TaxID=196821 RepID=UPI0035C17728